MVVRKEMNEGTANKGFSFWRQDTATLLKALSTTSSGLSSSETAERLDRFGLNVLHPAKKRMLLLQFLAKFRNPLVLILLVASAVLALTGDVTSFIIISVIVLISVTLDFVQNIGLGKLLTLRQSVAVRVQVLRDGKPLRSLWQNWCLEILLSLPLAIWFRVTGVFLKQRTFS